jgi:hypothetical protein
MKNWKTTIVGVIGAAGLAVFQLISTGSLDPKTLIIAAVVAGMGLLAKDHDVTGGTIMQSAIPLASAVLSEIPETKPNPVLDEIKSIVTGLAESQQSALNSAAADPIPQLAEQVNAVKEIVQTSAAQHAEALNSIAASLTTIASPPAAEPAQPAITLNIAPAAAETV